jgi:hypothetical protein
MGPSGPKTFFLALAWARRIPNGPWRVSASLARAGVSFAPLFSYTFFLCDRFSRVVFIAFVFQFDSFQGSRGYEQPVKPGSHFGLPS